MDYQRFIEELPELYTNWGQDGLQPKSTKFAEVLDRIEGMTTPNVMQLLNFAVECIEEDEIYCEVGCYQGSTLIGALLNHQHQLAYAVDSFAEFDREGKNQAKLADNLAKFNLDEKVIFCNQDFEEFFFDLREIDPTTKIGVYLYDGAHDYRSQLLGLMLVKPFLAPRALIIVDDSNWSCVKQANWDFMAANPECQLLLDLPTAKNGHRSFWNGIQVLSWDVNRPKIPSWKSFTNNFRDRNVIQSIYDLHFYFEFNKKPEIVQSLHLEADRLIEAGKLEAAEQKYFEALEW
ncbi:MAG: class I SAM-dependent methyltransferase [Prochloraceae cyanobacterium]|nr:class I SAM-dependent methyltransferase [Prochloraceae cyanobacterium]